MKIAANGGGGVDVQQLAEDEGIWGGHTMTMTLTKRRLHNLDLTALKGLLIIDDQVRLDARVVVTEE